jgi:hypothetical protein
VRQREKLGKKEKRMGGGGTDGFMRKFVCSCGLSSCQKKWVGTWAAVLGEHP